MSQEPKVTRFGVDPTVAQELATKAYVDAGGGGGQTFAKVVKSVDETIDTSTTFQDDDELFVALTANLNYAWQLWLFVTSGAVPDIKTAWTLPAGATGQHSSANWGSSGGSATANMTASDPLATGGGVQWVPFTGRVIMAGTAGNMQLQWAQNTSDAGDTTVLAGSVLVVWQE